MYLHRATERLFGVLVTSSLGFKAKVISLIRLIRMREIGYRGGSKILGCNGERLDTEDNNDLKGKRVKDNDYLA